VRPKIETRLVAVSVSGPDPREAQQWVNTVADVYVRRNVDVAVESFRGILDKIESGLRTSRETLGQADVANLQLAAGKDLYIPENQKEVLNRRLQAYNDELTKTRVEIGGLKAELDNLARIDTTDDDPMALPRVQQDANVQDLVAQRLSVERELQRIATEKRPQHPDYLARAKDLEKINQKIKDQIRRIADKLRTQYELAVANARYLEGQIRDVQEDAFRVQQANSNYEILKTDAQSKRKVYDTVAETMERLTLSAQLTSLSNNVSILDRAIEPRHPVKPNKPLAIAFGSILGLVLGVGSVLFLNYLDNTIRTPEDVENFLGLSVLAMVPRVKDSTDGAAKEAYQSLRTSILFSSQNRQKRVLLFSSAGPQEGKSSSVSALARTFAMAGERVVVVDCDLRRPTQHVRLGVSRDVGVTNFMLASRDEGYPSYLRDTDIPTLKVIPSGPIPPNPLDVIGSQRFSDLVAALRKDFDWVIIDSPPIMNLSDSLVLASMSEMVALVIRHNENDRDMIRRCVRQLQDVKAPIIGAVLNSVDRTHYNDYYYAGYYGDDDADKVRKGRRGGAESGKRVAL
jgi:capsular exopolysaccharide synthesis family protein